MSISSNRNHSKHANFTGILSVPDLITTRGLLIFLCITSLFVGSAVIADYSNSYWKLPFTVLYGLSSSILAGLLFAFIYHRKENEKLEIIRKVGQQELIEEVLREVAHYEGIYCVNHIMDACLRPHPNNNSYYLCTITHRYNKSHINKNLVFVFHRVINDDISDIPEIADEALIREFIWQNDEKDFATKPTEDDYRIENIFVNGKRYLPSIEIKNNHIFYSCELPQTFDQLTAISFDATFPMERESTLNLTSEFPSKGITMNFRWSDLLVVNPNIVTYSIAKIGLKTNPAMIQHQPNSHEINYLGWALPKDSCTFTWWKNDNNMESA